jgi:hypothetical protein
VPMTIVVSNCTSDLFGGLPKIKLILAWFWKESHISNAAMVSVTAADIAQSVR